MPFHSIIITGCSLKSFEEFARTELQGVVEECRVDERDLVCRVPQSKLEYAFSRLKEEAKKGWENPDNEKALHFDSAFFPKSEEKLEPMRQLRGLIAARLARKKDNLPPAYATPGFVFGTAPPEG